MADSDKPLDDTQEDEESREWREQAGDVRERATQFIAMVIGVVREYAGPYAVAAREYLEEDARDDARTAARNTQRLLRQLYTRLQEENTPENRETAKTVGKWGTAAVLLIGVPLTTLWLSFKLAGVIDTIAYAVLFLVGVSFLPTTILFMAPSFTGSMKSMFGKLHFILGQVAFGTGYLVQRESKWEMCPGDRDRVYIDGDWHEIEGGKTNFSVLGWKRFGMLRYKTEDTLRDVRVDPKNIVNAAQTDGGMTTVERAGYEEVPPAANVSGISSWLVDLKRVYTHGLKKIGDIALIEKAEEVAMRNEAKNSRIGGWEPVIGSLVGLALGVATGYVLLGGA